MVIPRKPWTFGSERVSACDCNPCVTRRLELVEGKDWPEHLGFHEFEEMGKIVGKMMRLTRPVWRIGSKVTMYSVFCATKGLVESCERGVVAAMQKNQTLTCVLPIR